MAGATPLLLIGIIVFGSTVGLVAWKPPLAWTDQFGNPSMVSGVGGVATDNTSTYVEGFQNGSGTSNGEFGAPFVTKYNDRGSIVWTSKIEKVPVLFLLDGIAVRPDGVYSVGETGSNATLFKQDLNGKMSWSTLVIAAGGNAAITASVSGVYVAGIYNYPITNQTFTGAVFFLRQYDPDGKMLWTTEYANSTSPLAGIRGIFSQASGVYIVTGDGLVAYSSAGVQLWSHLFGARGFIIPFSVSADSTGVYVAGTVKSSTISLPTGFLTKFDFKGSTVWNEVFDSPDQGGLGRTWVSADSSGVYVSMVSGGLNGFVNKYDSAGNQIWSFQTPQHPKGFLSSPDEFIVTAGLGGFYLGGAIQSPQGTYGLVQAFAGSSSLIFLGLNPPFSFILLGGMVALAVLSVLLFKRMFGKRMVRHPKSASARTTSKSLGVPSD